MLCFFVFVGVSTFFRVVLGLPLCMCDPLCKCSCALLYTSLSPDKSLVLLVGGPPIPLKCIRFRIMGSRSQSLRHMLLSLFDTMNTLTFSSLICVGHLRRWSIVIANYLIWSALLLLFPLNLTNNRWFVVGYGGKYSICLFEGEI